MPSLKEIAVSRKDLPMIAPKDLTIVPGWNVREDLGDLEELKQIIVNNGLPGVIKIYVPQKKETLLTKDGTYEAKPGDRLIVDGHRRMTCITQLQSEGYEIKAVPCVVEDKFTSEGERLLRQETENSGKHLAPLERGELYRRLVRFGWTAEEIAKRTGKSLQTVNNYLGLTASSPEVLGMVKEGQVSATTVIRIHQEATSPDEATSVISLVAQNQATAEAAVEAIKVSGGDAEKAAEVLAGAIEAAKAEGKPKAKTKHVNQLAAGALNAGSSGTSRGSSGGGGSSRVSRGRSNVVPITRDKQDTTIKLLKKIVRQSPQNFTEEGVIITASTADWKALLKTLDLDVED